MADTLGVVMPVHSLHFKWARLFEETLGWCGAEGFAWYPVFSSHADLERFDGAWVAGNVIRTMYGQRMPLIINADEANPPTSQKWRALRAVFSMHAVRYVMTLDPETVLVSEASALRVRSLLTNWSTRRLVLGSTWTPRVSGGYFAKRPPIQVNMTNASCHALGLSQNESATVQHMLPTYIAWSDAPLYDRDDFDAFWARISLHGLGKLSREVHDSAAYMCYKLLERGWRFVNVDRQTNCPGRRWCNAVEHATLAEQREITRVHGYRFMWLEVLCHPCKCRPHITTLIIPTCRHLQARIELEGHRHGGSSLTTWSMLAPLPTKPIGTISRDLAASGVRSERLNVRHGTV